MNTTAAEVLERELKGVNLHIKRLAMQIASYAEEINRASQELATLTHRADELRNALRQNPPAA